MAGDGWAPIVERCRRVVCAGSVDSSALPWPYDRYRPEELLDLLADGWPEPSPDRPRRAVLCHGAPTLDEVLVDDGRLVGFDGFDAAMLADRHLDLAVAHLAVADVLGAEAVIGLHEGYGVEAELGSLDRAILPPTSSGPRLDDPRLAEGPVL